MALPFFFKIDYGLFRIIGLKYGKEILIFHNIDISQIIEFFGLLRVSDDEESVFLLKTTEGQAIPKNVQNSIKLIQEGCHNFKV